MDFSDAITFGSVEDVIEALRSGGDPNMPDRLGRLPLRLAVNRGNLKIATLLIESGAYVDARDASGHSPLCQAVLKKSVDLINLLLDHGADFLCECGCGGLIAMATLVNAPEIVGKFASMGADINSYNPDGFTPLMLAAGNEANSAIPVLLAHGAQVGLRDRKGLTAHLHAALVGNVTAAELLIAAGASANEKDYEGKTAAMLASENGHPWKESAGGG
jgi:ankyrin repeat protein